MLVSRSIGSCCCGELFVLPTLTLEKVCVSKHLRYTVVLGWNVATKMKIMSDLLVFQSFSIYTAELHVFTARDGYLHRKLAAQLCYLH